MIKALFNQYRLLFRPEIYHRKGYKNFFFEGWFYKLVSADRRNVIAIIPAVVQGNDPKCFIQILDGTSHKSSVAFYGADKLDYKRDRFFISMGENKFSLDGMELDINSDYRIKGALSFSNPTRYASSVLRPNIMGWYSYVPLMECNHATLSLSSKIRGSLEINGMQVDFSNGKVYIEKDWGSSFPGGYLWCQSNHFDDADTSFIFSVAKIPWLISSFTGFLSVFNFEGKQHNFATYTGAKIANYSVSKETVNICIKKRSLTLEFEIERAAAGELIAPYSMSGLTKVTESLSSVINLSLKNGSSTLFRGTGIFCGLDINGIDLTGSF